MKIRKATKVFDKVLYSSYEDYETYPDSIYQCDRCGEKVSFAFKDLDKHRFGSFSNFSIETQNEFDELAQALIPVDKMSTGRQNGAYTKEHIRVISKQRYRLRFKKGKFTISWRPRKGKAMPDSFIDFNCPKCNRPVRIYYSSYLGGRHCEHGYQLEYVID
mgnify:CR=1 FL=1